MHTSAQTPWVHISTQMDGVGYEEMHIIAHIFDPHIQHIPNTF